ncbi:MAG: SH3 domain-containing protein [Spirochaetes bacterium]|nr:SH3 domain-containing protein [Spirochaetota bacterium]
MKRYLIITAILSIHSIVNAGSIEYCWVDQLSLRKGPSSASEIITFLKEGDEVELLEIDHGANLPVNLRGMKFYTKWSKVRINGVEGFIYGGGIRSGYFLFLYDRFLNDEIVEIEKTSDNIFKIALTRKYCYSSGDAEGTGIGTDELETIVGKYRINNITQKQFNKLNPVSFELDAKIEAEIHLSEKDNYYYIENVDEKIIQSRIIFSK